VILSIGADLQPTIHTFARRKPVFNVSFGWYGANMKKSAAKKKASSKTQKIFCTVCPKWEIQRPERCSSTKTHKGVLRYFCTAKCKERFEKAPEKFL
jgi:hypothetical protein